nr:hypothetical protein [Tanacetum cinerariifolium]
MTSSSTATTTTVSTVTAAITSRAAYSGCSLVLSKSYCCSYGGWSGCCCSYGGQESVSPSTFINPITAIHNRVTREIYGKDDKRCQCHD